VCKHDPSIGDSDSLGEAGLGLLKVDDVPDCGKVLHEGTNYEISRQQSIARGLTSALTFLYWQVKQNPLVRVFKARKYATWR